jgi:hypothetical protein
VFLGRAIDAIGRATYGAEWTGTERRSPARAIAIPPPPEAASAAQHQIEFAGSILSRFDPFEFAKYSEKFAEDGEWLGDQLSQNSKNGDDYEEREAEYDPITDTLPTEFWQRANEVYVNSEIALRESHRRWQSVQISMLHVIRSGALKVSVRRIDRGVFKQLDPAVWNVENLWWRFEACTIDPKRPYDQPDAGYMDLRRPHDQPDLDPFDPDLPREQSAAYRSRMHYMYVDRQGLDAAVAGASSNPVTPECYDAFSPYLKLAIQVAIDRQKNPDGLKGKGRVDAHIEARWPLSSKPSKNVIDAISYVVRDPDTRPDEHRGFHVKDGARKG